MRFPLSCAQCMHDDLESAASTVQLTEFRDGSSYEFECQKGHKTVVILQQQKFEILFQIGAYAISDGYYREAISSFSTSLERFFEFFIRASLIETKIENDAVVDSWKLVAAQSERQLGAYIFVYLLTTGSPPRLLPQKEVELRNGVIHRGRIPTRDEALRYGNAVLEIIRLGISIGKEKFPKGFQAAVLENLGRDGQAAANLGFRSATASVGTIVSLNIDDTVHQTQTLEDAIAKLPDWRSSKRRMG